MPHKKIVHQQIAIALMLLAIIYGAIAYYSPYAPSADVVARLAYACTLQVFIVFPLYIGIMVAVYMRYSSANLIQGYGATTEEKFSLVQAYNKNTVEQTLLHALSIFTFCSVVPAYLLKFAVAQVLAYLLGRALFAIGYKINPLYRLTGFALGSYPAYLAILISSFFALQKVFL
jgi:hypothetical protein